MEKLNLNSVIDSGRVSAAREEAKKRGLEDLTFGELLKPFPGNRALSAWELLSYIFGKEVYTSERDRVFDHLFESFGVNPDWK